MKKYLIKSKNKKYMDLEIETDVPPEEIRESLVDGVELKEMKND